MFAIYIVSAVVGGFLVLLSAIGGGEHGADGVHEFDGGGIGDGELDHDFGHHGSDHDGGAGTWIPFLSLRFWTYFLGAFGVTGLLLTKVANLPEPFSAWLSAGTGALCGLTIAYAMRLVQRAEADSSAKIDEMLGTEAKVLVPIHPNQPGKIRFTLKGETIELLALSNDDDADQIGAGADVVIVAIEKDRARVVPRAALYG